MNSNVGGRGDSLKAREGVCITIMMCNKIIVILCALQFHRRMGRVPLGHVAFFHWATRWG